MRRSTTRQIWSLIEGFRVRYATAVACLVIASCFLYLAPMVVQATIDGVLIEREGAAPAITGTILGLIGGRDLVARHLWWPAVVVIGVTAVAGIFTYLRGRLAAEASEGVVRRLRDRVYDQLQHLPATYFDASETGDLVQRCTSDVETVRVFLSRQVVEIGRAIVMLLLPLPIMAMVDWRMTVASVVLIPLITAFSLVFFIKVKRVFKAADEAEGRLTSTIQENLTGIRVVRAFARQEFEREKLEARNTEHRERDYRLYVLLARFWSVSDLLCFSQKAIVLGLGLYLLMRGDLPVGAFYFFLTAVAMFIWPVRMMGRILTDLGKAIVALGRIREILEAERERDPDVQTQVPAAGRLRGAIAFDHVSFAYGAGVTALDDVSFEMAAGETVALLGPSGSGKSTIVRLLLRLHDPDAGMIRVDGIDLRTMPRKFVRGQMAVVLQEPFLYSKTLRQNIVIAASEADEAAMIEAASAAQVHDAIERFEQGYDTHVGERGVTLSGGQRQRVALARALLPRPPVLVLDDALSAVDTETERAILDALRRRHGHQTTIVIAHRLSTLQHADKVVVLDEGRVAQCGTHEQLLREPGLYRRLWDIQRAGDDAVLAAFDEGDMA